MFMKKILMLLVLSFTIVGCSTPEQKLDFWQEMYMKAARDANTAETSSEYRDARNRMERYEQEVNKAHNNTL